MSNWPFRFVHAGDFHLERLPHGLAEVPDHLRELFIESAYMAAERVFETVLAEEAELLILCGDILHPQQTGPRGPLFLVEQFKRLAEREIPVYWAGGRVDPTDAWPSMLDLPENVHVFPKGHVEEFVHHRDGTPLVRLMGVGHDRNRHIRPTDFEPDPAGLFTIAAVHGTTDAKALQARGIHYWALGGRHHRNTPLSGVEMAHYPGSPQGRCPEESGPHGCTLVRVESKQARTSMVPTDAMRFLDAKITVDEQTTHEEMEDDFRRQITSSVDAAPQADLLISWTVAGEGPLHRQLRRGGLAGEMLDWLRAEYGFGPPAAWSVSLKAEPPASLPGEYYEQETILGDFLRSVRQSQMNSDEPVELEPYIAEKHLAGTLGASMALRDGPPRDHVLREAAMLGLDLLSGEEATI